MIVPINPPPRMSYQLCAASMVSEPAIRTAPRRGKNVRKSFQKAGLWSAQTLSLALSHRKRNPNPAKAAVVWPLGKDVMAFWILDLSGWVQISVVYMIW